MKKLNNQEITALTSTIILEISENNKSKINISTKSKYIWEKEFRKTTKFKEFVKLNLLIANFKDTYTFNMGGWIDRAEIVPYFVNYCYKEYTTEVIKNLGLKSPNTEDIKNKIILSQIECENLQEIINNIKKEYNLIVQ